MSHLLDAEVGDADCLGVAGLHLLFHPLPGILQAAKQVGY